MKITFWLLDINAEVKAGVPQLWLWGIDSTGNRVLVIDRRFIDYFYVVVKEEVDAAKVAKEIRKVYGGSVVKLEVASRKLFGADVQTVKVYCDDTVRLAKALRSFEGVKECLEEDVRTSMRYLIDNNVVPCSWHSIEVREEKNVYRVRADKVYLAESAPYLLDQPEAAPPCLRLLSFSMVSYSREGSPHPDKDPVIIISTVNSRGEQKQFIVDEERKDRQILQQFIDYIQKFDPDIIVGYGTNDKYMAYLRSRCHSHRLKFKLDRANTEPHTSVYGHTSLTGIGHLDLADFMDLFPEVKVKSIENLAEHLGIMPLEGHEVIWDVDFSSYWDSPEKRGALIQFTIDTAQRVIGTANVLLDFAMQLSSLVSLPLDHVMTAAVGFRVDWFLIKRAQKIGELIPKRTEEPYRTYTGGLVLTPQPGLHENIAVLDFKSMYPNLMIAYNISPDTYISPKEEVPLQDVYEAPEVKHKFRKQPAGFYKEALTYLMAVRTQIRSKMKSLSRQSVEYQILDARQRAIKIITNAVYGYAGWIGARWFSKPVAEAASAWGRDIIQKAVIMAKDAQLQVIYGDTDSLFVNHDVEKTAQLENTIKEKLGLGVEKSNLYVRVFFTEAKKRYAGLREDGTIDYVGLEVIRGDWAEVAKKVQEQVIEIILKENKPDKAKDHVYSVISALKKGKVPYRDLVIWKTLTRPIGKYTVNAAHVEAASILKSKGWRLSTGDKVGYVTLKGGGPLYKRVKPYMFASLNEVDFDYYACKQIVPAAARVLSSFGITEKELLNSVKSKEKQSQEKGLEKYLHA